MNYKTILAVVGGILFIFSLIFLIASEIRWFENTFDSVRMAAYAAILGFLIGAGVAYRVAKKLSDSLDKVRATLAILIVLSILFPLAASITNRLLSSNPVHQEEVVLFKEIPYYSGRFGLPPKDQLQWTGYYIFVVRNDKIERLTAQKAHFLPEMAGQNVQIPIKKGFWGYDIAFLDEIY